MRVIGAQMESQFRARSTGPRSSSSSSSCNQAPIYGISRSQSELDTWGMSTAGEESKIISQVLFPKDYILSKVFRRMVHLLVVNSTPSPKVHMAVTEVH